MLRIFSGPGLFVNWVSLLIPISKWESKHIYLPSLSYQSALVQSVSRCIHKFCIFFFFNWSGWDESSPGEWNSAPWHQTRQYNACYRWRWSVCLQTYRLWCCKRTWRWWTICFSLWHRRVFSKPIWFHFLLKKCLKPGTVCDKSWIGEGLTVGN